MTLRDQNVLVTGGAGAFGRAFVRRCLDDGAARVVVFSRDEAKHAALRATLADPRVRYFVGDVRDADRVRWAVRGVDTVIHAAAMKRVDACADNADEAIATNVTGTQHVARAAIREGVSRAILLSTDKAASPSTLYGKTKAAGEDAWVQTNTYAAGTGTMLSCTRYGNVLGSTGSVVPIWRDQAQRVGEIVVTDPSATRFWMTMADAVDLVLLALRHMRGGEVFVPRLKSASVETLARALHGGVPQRVIGLQSGEKLHETLIGEDEAARTYSSEPHCTTPHYTITPAHQTWTAASVVPGVKVTPSFTLRSDTAPTWTVAQLREVVL